MTELLTIWFGAQQGWFKEQDVLRPAGSEEPNLDLIHHEIERISGLKARWLRFPAALESRFEADTAPRRCIRFWFEGLMAIVLFDLLLFADHLNGPVYFHRAAIIRLGLITPLALMVNFNMLRLPGRILREASVALVACAAGMAHLLLQSGQSAVSAEAQLGLVAVLLFANTFMRLRVPYALACTVLLVLGDLSLLSSDHTLVFQGKAVAVCFLLGIAAVTMISNYSFCREERLNFLLCLQGVLTVKELNIANEKLQKLAERDALTGLANRRVFEAALVRLWQDAFLLGRPLSLIIVDVDHFKSFNDTFGHLYGDKVLARIGKLLAESLRRRDDLAARFGGEEFVILLPDTTQMNAITVGERICQLTRLAGLPAMDPSIGRLNGRSATVSCGVATTIPLTNGGHEGLLLAADQALYQAKQAGRDRVCCAPKLEMPQLAGPQLAGREFADTQFADTQFADTQYADTQFADRELHEQARQLRA